MANKTTKKEFFAMLLAINEVSNNSELVDFITHEISLLDNKARKSASKRADANSELADKLLAELTAIDKAVTVSDFAKVSATAKAEELSGQKISAVFSKLKKAGVIEREEVKGKAYFSAVKAE